MLSISDCKVISYILINKTKVEESQCYKEQQFEMSGRVRKHSTENLLSQKVGPVKATLPMSSVLRSTLHQGNVYNCNFLPVLSSPIKHISPEHSICGHRSPLKGSSDCSGIRRTASLDALYIPPSWSLGMVSTILHLDKSTQTDESQFDRTKMLYQQQQNDLSVPSSIAHGSTLSGNIKNDIASSEIRIEKVIRQRWQKTQRGVEHSVSSQTLSPIHGKASPVTIPQRTNSQIHIRPMRNSVEGLNQEIEKLVLYTSQTYSSRNESGLFSRATPEGHRAPLAELFHSEMRSVNTQTPVGDVLSSDGSHSTSPEDGISLKNASPRINRFLAREPPDGCEKVCLKPTEIDQGTTALFKPSVGFKLKPSLCSAFQPLQPILITKDSKSEQSDQSEE